MSVFAADNTGSRPRSRHIQRMRDPGRKQAETGGTDETTVTLHASCVSLDGTGILITGPSGSGKSDLALRLIDGGASLVADDVTTIVLVDGAPVAQAPERLAGRLEIRGVGIATVPASPRARLGLVVGLHKSSEIERLPEALFQEVLGVPVRVIHIDPFTASAAAKIRLAATAGPIETA